MVWFTRNKPRKKGDLCVQTYAKQVIPPHLVTCTLSIVYIGSNDTRLHNTIGCFVIKPLGLLLSLEYQR